MQNKKSGVRNAAWLLLCFAASVLGIVIWPAFLLVPALWTAAMFRSKPYWLIPLALVTFACAYTFYGTAIMGVCSAALSALPSLALYIMQKRRLGNVYTAAVMAGLSLVSIYGMICLPGVLAGEGAFTAAEAAMDETVAVMRSLGASTPGMTEQLLGTWNTYLDMFEDTMASMIVAVMCAVSCTLALSNFLLFRLFVRKRDFGLRKLSAFADWSIPRSMTGGLCLLIVASLIIGFTQWEFAAGFSATVNVIVGFPLIVQGLCVMDYFIRRSRGRVTMIRTLVYIGVALLFSFVQSILMLIGCAEMLFHLRERFALGNGQRPPMPPM